MGAKSSLGRATTTGRTVSTGWSIVAAFALPPAFVVGLVVLVVLPPLGVVVFFALGIGLAVWVGQASRRRASVLCGGAKADAYDHARLVNLVDGLCVATGVGFPQVRVLDDSAVNIAVFGRSSRDAVVLVTSGLLEELSRIELEAVLAHQLICIKQGLIEAPTFGVIAFGPGARLALGSLGSAGGARTRAVVLGLPFLLPRLIFDRSSGAEHRAAIDAEAMAITRYPPGLVGALEKLDAKTTALRTVAPEVAHLWMADPLPAPPVGGEAPPMLQRFLRHPPMWDRIEGAREL